MFWALFWRGLHLFCKSFVINWLSTRTIVSVAWQFANHDCIQSVQSRINVTTRTLRSQAERSHEGLKEGLLRSLVRGNADIPGYQVGNIVLKQSGHPFLSDYRSDCESRLRHSAWKSFLLPCWEWTMMNTEYISMRGKNGYALKRNRSSWNLGKNHLFRSLTLQAGIIYMRIKETLHLKSE